VNDVLIQLPEKAYKSSSESRGAETISEKTTTKPGFRRRICHPEKVSTGLRPLFGEDTRTNVVWCGCSRCVVAARSNFGRLIEPEQPGRRKHRHPFRPFNLTRECAAEIKGHAGNSSQVSRSQTDQLTTGSVPRESEPVLPGHNGQIKLVCTRDHFQPARIGPPADVRPRSDSC